MDTTKLITYLGLVKGLIISTIDFTLHSMSVDGFSFSSPVFWLGLGWAAVDVVKSYFTAGVTPKP